MRQILLVFTIILVLLLTSGCTQQFPKPVPGVTTAATPAPLPRYVIGDIVTKNPGDDLGEVITDYTAGSSYYTSRTVIFDKYGTVFYYEGGGTGMRVDEFESRYPYKRAHIDNPYGLKTFVKEYQEKYSVNQVAAEKENAIEGIKIISFDYPRDTYTYVYVHRQGGTWLNESDTVYNGARTDIEKKYKTTG
jgi:hypothetical protein